MIEELREELERQIEELEQQVEALQELLELRRDQLESLEGLEDGEGPFVGGDPWSDDWDGEGEYA